MFRHTPLRYATLALLAAGAVVQAFRAEYFGLEIIVEIAVLALVVLALDMVAGFGGMVSLCHGALMGLGAYAYAALTVSAGVTPPLAIAGAVAVTGGAAWIIGAICARAHGIYFIMATLAFGQMAYSFVFESRALGGDDGISGIPRLDLSAFGIDLMDGRTFALAAIALVAAVYAFAAVVLRSGLGRSLTGVMHNEQRMRALGLNVWRVKADVFGVSGMIAGLAGAIAAQHIMFVSPTVMSWTVSGEALVVVILGGLGTLVGPIIGAIAFVVLKHEVSALTDHWHMVVGLILIAVVMSGANGIFGAIESLARRLTGRLPRPARDAGPAAREVTGDA